MKMSWVTLDRFCEEQRLSDEEIHRRLEASGRPLRSSAAGLSDEELLEKLREFGFDFDRAGLERLCEGALSAEEVAKSLLDRCDFRNDAERMEGEWIWVCMVALWERWWPEKVCLELLDDKVQAGYRELQASYRELRGREAAGAATWLSAWSDVVRLCDITGIHSIEEFDDRFPMTQSLYNWSQDLEEVLWNAGLKDPELLRARIAVCDDALRRFPDEDQLMTENRRQALAESYFEVGETERAEALFEQWLAGDPRWGWGWVGWADFYFFMENRPKDYGRAEELLRRGYSTPDVRNREAIAGRLRRLCRETGRLSEAEQFERQAKQPKRRRGSTTVSRKLELEESQDGTAAVLREGATVTFGGEGLPLDQFASVVRAPEAAASREPARAVKVGRNAPCPCGSGQKFKKCCGSGQPRF
jgi:tetratricopeptide (TPR) repeat protein